MYNKHTYSSGHQSAHFVVAIVKMGAVDTITWASFYASCPDTYTLPSVTLRNTVSFPNLMPRAHQSARFVVAIIKMGAVNTIIILRFMPRHLHPPKRNFT